MSINALVPDHILKLTPYQSARRIGGKGHIWLNANENPMATPYQLTDQSLNRYGDCQPKRVLDAYAHYTELTSEQIILSRGADEAIELLIKAFCQPGKDKILYCPPTYGMYGITAQTYGIACQVIPLTADWQLDLPALLAQLAEVKLIYLCRPNNPTANLLHAQDIKTLLLACQGQALVIVDEAYIEFCAAETLVSWLPEHTNLVILRTLSKAFALAGLRCGFTLANPSIIHLLLKVIAPYPVATPVADIAAQALTRQGIEQMRQKVNELNVIKANLIDQLRGYRLIDDVFASDTNFILIRSRVSQQLFNYLWQLGIIIRDQRQAFALQDCLRITVGNLFECQSLMAAIHNFATTYSESSLYDRKISFY